MSTFRVTAAAALLGAACLLALPAAAIEYTIVELTPPGGFEGYFVRATGLNASGQVTGSLEQYRPRDDGYEVLSQAFVTGPGGAGMRSLGKLGSSRSTEGAGINDAGQVVGTARSAGGASRGFIVAPGGPMRDLGTLGGANSSAHAINGRGQVVGTADTATGVSRPFISAPGAGALRDLASGISGALDSRDLTGLLNINSNGQVAGSVTKPQDFFNFVNLVTGPDGSAPRVVPPPPRTPRTGDYPTINDINDNGDVLMTVSNPYLPVETPLYVIAADGSTIPISVTNLPGWEGGNLGGSGQYGPVSRTQGFALNENRQVGGFVRNSRHQESHAFITEADGQNITRVRDLDFVGDLSHLPALFDEVTDINDAGQFVANVGVPGVGSRSFLISPIPEPSTVTLLLAGAGLVAWAGRCSAAQRRP